MMELTTSMLSHNLDLVVLIPIAVIIAAVFTASFMFSSQSVIFNCSSITKLEQKTHFVSPLSEYHYRADNKEHEFKERIDRKRNIVYTM